jgi:plasmid stability protein
MISVISSISMATILIRGLEESVKTALKRRAAENGRSLEEEARQILKLEAARSRAATGLGTWLRDTAREIGAGELPLPPRSAPPRKPPFPHDEPDT